MDEFDWLVIQSATKLVDFVKYLTMAKKMANEEVFVLGEITSLENGIIYLWNR